MKTRNLLGAMVAVGIVTSMHTVAAATRPNILFCIADDASYAHFSANGCTWVNTPSFDRIAREGLLFRHAYTPNSKCAPSRAVVLTGRNSWQLESAANHGGSWPEGKYLSFVEALGQKGYFTGMTGKGWGPGEPGQLNGHPRQLAGKPYNALKKTPLTDKISPVDYAANFEAFLRDRPTGQPFCFWFGAHEPHRDYSLGSGVRVGKKSPAQIDRVPLYLPDTPAVRNDMLDYAVEVEYYDTQLGLILEVLEKSGELENTIIVVTSDNAMPFPRLKGTTYEAALHLPLAIRWGKGITRPGRVVDDLVSFIDFAPTFLEAAGIDRASTGMEAIQGHSLGRIFRNEFGGRIEPGRDVLYTGQERHDMGRPEDEGYPVRGMLTARLLYLHNFEPSRWPMCDPITGYLNTDGGPSKTAVLEENRKGINHWRWVLDFGRRPSEELYDLEHDPDCVINLAEDSDWTSTKDRMREQLFAELRKQGDPRMQGNGAVFDRYPYTATLRNFYSRYLKGEKMRTGWVEETDYESPDFDPERPLAPRAGVAVAKEKATKK